MAGGYGGATGQPAAFGKRAIAYLIDIGILLALVVAVVIAAGILGAVSDALGLLFGTVGYLGVSAYGIWNIAYLQGTTGQSLGKRQQGIRLIAEATGQPVGFGMAFLRYLVAGLFTQFTCGLYGILDTLWPLWDAKRQRLTDKVFKMAVVDTDQPANLTAEALNPFTKL